MTDFLFFIIYNWKHTPHTEELIDIFQNHFKIIFRGDTTLLKFAVRKSIRVHEIVNYPRKVKFS